VPQDFEGPSFFFPGLPSLRSSFPQILVTSDSRPPPTVKLPLGLFQRISITNYDIPLHDEDSLFLIRQKERSFPAPPSASWVPIGGSRSISRSDSPLPFGRSLFQRKSPFRKYMKFFPPFIETLCFMRPSLPLPLVMTYPSSFQPVPTSQLC